MIQKYMYAAFLALMCSACSVLQGADTPDTHEGEWLFTSSYSAEPTSPTSSSDSDKRKRMQELNRAPKRHRTRQNYGLRSNAANGTAYKAGKAIPGANGTIRWDGRTVQQPKIESLKRLALIKVMSAYFSGFSYVLKRDNNLSKKTRQERYFREFCYTGNLKSLKELQQEEDQFCQSSHDNARIHTLIVELLSELYDEKIKENLPLSENTIDTDVVHQKKCPLLCYDDDFIKPPLFFEKAGTPLYGDRKKIPDRLVNAFLLRFAEHAEAQKKIAVKQRSYIPRYYKVYRESSSDENKITIKFRYSFAPLTKKPSYANSISFTYMPCRNVKLKNVTLKNEKGEEAAVEEKEKAAVFDTVDTRYDTVIGSFVNKVENKTENCEFPINGADGEKSGIELLDESKDQLDILVHWSKSDKRANGGKVGTCFYQYLLPGNKREKAEMKFISEKELSMNPLQLPCYCNLTTPYLWHAGQNYEVTSDYNGSGYCYTALRKFRIALKRDDKELCLAKVKTSTVSLVQVKNFKYIADIIKAYQFRTRPEEEDFFYEVERREPLL